MKTGLCLFDLYGTLAAIHTDERRPAPWLALAESIRAAGGREVPLKALRSRYLELCRAQERLLEARFALPEIDLAPVFAALLEENGVPPETERVRAAAWAFRRASTDTLRSYAGARELLEELRGRGLRPVLLSNAQRLFTEPELRLLGLWDCFERVYISSDCGCRKPDPAFFRRPLEELGVRAEHCLMIGNDPDCDIRPAHALGMKTIYLHTRLSPAFDPAAPADRVLRGMDLRRLRRVLERELPSVSLAAGSSPGGGADQEGGLK